MHSQAIPSTATVARMMNVFLYTADSGAETGSSGPMISVTRPPTTASSTSRVWMRPPSVGSTVVPPMSWSRGGPGPNRKYSGLFVPCPAEPLPNRPECANPPAEPAPGQIVGYLLGSSLQSEEGVDTGEVATQSGSARCVHDSGAAPRTAQFERAFNIQTAERVAPGTSVDQQVGEHAVLRDVRFQAGAVDHEVGGDFGHAVRGIDATNDLAVLQSHRPDRARHGAVPAAFASLLHLRLPAPAVRRIGSAHELVLRGPLIALQPAHLRLELAAPD